MKIHKTATISNLAQIDSSVEIGQNVIIEGNVKIDKNVKILPNVYIGDGTTIEEGTVIHMGAIIGHVPQDYAYKGGKSFTKIGKNNIIREYVTIHRATDEGASTVIGDNVFLMVQVHVAHNVVIENSVIVANGSILAGHMYVEKGAFISGNVVFHQFCRVGRYAMIGGFSGVNKDVPPYMLVRGPSTIRGINLIGLRRANFSKEVIREIKEAYKMLFLSDMTMEESLEKMEKTLLSDEAKHFIDFVKNSKRRICKIRFSKEEFF